MVILSFDPHGKLIIPRNETLLLDAQSTQDHALTLHWTRDMPRANQPFYTRPALFGAAAISDPARAQRYIPTHAHAAHHAEIVESFSPICGDHETIENSTHAKLPGSVAANDTPVKSTFPRAGSARTAEDRGESGAPCRLTA